MRLNLIKFGTVKSTNDIAIKIIRSKKSNAGIIVSDYQTKGRGTMGNCLLYTSDAADERSSVDLGGRRIIKKKYAKT